MKSKAIGSVKIALLKCFKLYRPKSILCDKESSFYSHEISSLLKNYKVKLFSQLSAPTLKWKNGIVERAQRTLRMLIARYCEEHHLNYFINNLSQICDIFNSRVNRNSQFSPFELHNSPDAIARYQKRLITKLATDVNSNNEQMNKHGLNDSLQLGDLVRFKILSKSFSKEIDKKYSQSVHTIVEVKKSNPYVFKIFPTPPDQNRYFYREELSKINPEQVRRGDIPIEKIISRKTLPNGEKIFQCSLVGSDKEEWLTASSLKNRFILFPDAELTALLSNTHRNYSLSTRKTRNQLRNEIPIISNGVVTRSKAKL